MSSGHYQVKRDKYGKSGSLEIITVTAHLMSRINSGLFYRADLILRLRYGMINGNEKKVDR